jgi:hypothetical protein
MRRGALPAHLHDATPLHTELVGFISRAAPAAPTGLPREAVRRIVNEMFTDGLLSLGRAAVWRSKQVYWRSPRLSRSSWRWRTNLVPSQIGCFFSGFRSTGLNLIAGSL